MQCKREIQQYRVQLLLEHQPTLHFGRKVVSLSFRVGTNDNYADGPGAVRAASPATPFWLKAVLTGNLDYIAAVRLTDNIAGPVGKRARLSAVLLLALRDAQDPPGLGSGAFSSQP